MSCSIFGFNLLLVILILLIFLICVFFYIYQYNHAGVGDAIGPFFCAMSGCIIFIVCCVVQWIFLLMTTLYCPSGFIMFPINTIVLTIIVIMLVYVIINILLDK